MAKKKKKQKKTSKKYALYDTSGGLKRKNKFCPKCGAGFFLAGHKDRLTCGKCGYMETKSKD
jgi:small subunit ribosomal protein S27Ae